MPRGDHQTTQAIGGVIQGDIDARARELAERLTEQEGAFRKAIDSVDDVREFVGHPEHILGRDNTKHGEIAEHVEVGIRNARDYLRQRVPTASFEGVGRIAETDYLIDGVAVQSKFINGANKSLDHVLAHLKQYEQFGRDGSFYHIPKDYHGVIDRIARGEGVSEFNARTIRAIESKVAEIERLTGKPLGAVVQPGVSEYAEVTRGNIHKTLDGHEADLRDENRDINRGIRDDARPGMAEAAGAVGKGAVVGGAVRLTLSLYKKAKEGKNPFRGEFTPDDWKDVGLETAKGAAQGGVAAGALYGLTQYSALAAPFAGAVVSTTTVLAELVRQRQAGEIDDDTFTELGMFACAEGGLVGLCSAAGQVVIPIPVLGAVVGAVAGRLMASVMKDWLGGMEQKLQQRLDSYYAEAIAKLDEEYQSFVDGLIADFDRLGKLTEAAFNLDANTELRLEASIRLARAYDVADAEIIHNTDELDTFMLE